MLAVATLLQGSVLFLNALLNNFGHEAWVGFLVAMIIVGFFLFATYSQENIYEVCRKQFGKAVGNFISAVFICYFTLTASYNINLLSAFIGGYVLEETPKFIFIMFFTLLCAYGAYKGAENLIRLSAVFFSVAVITEILNVFLLWDKIEVKNFKPFFSRDVKYYVKNIFTSAVLLMGDMSIWVCFKKKDVVKKHIIYGFIAGSIILFFILVRSIGALGEMLSVYTWPLHESLRIINSGNVATRIETSSVFVMLAMIFLKCGLFYSGAVEGIKNVFNTDKKFIVIGCVAVAICILSNVLFKSGVTAMEIWTKYAAYVIIPIIIISVTIFKLKRINKKNLQDNIK